MHKSAWWFLDKFCCMVMGQWGDDIEGDISFQRILFLLHNKFCFCSLARLMLIPTEVVKMISGVTQLNLVIDKVPYNVYSPRILI